MADFEKTHEQWAHDMLETERAPRRKTGFLTGIKIGVIAATDYCSGDKVIATTDEQWYRETSNIVSELTGALTIEGRETQSPGIIEAVYEVFAKEKPF